MVKKEIIREKVYYKWDNGFGHWVFVEIEKGEGIKGGG